MKRFLAVFSILFLSFSAQAGFYTWTDGNGVKHFTDKAEQLPSQYRAIIREGQSQVEVNGVGYVLDETGVYHFYQKSQAVEQKPEAAGASGLKPVPPGLHITAKNDSWKGPPKPEVVEAKVKKIISGDTLQLEDGTKLKYIGIVFPEEFKGKNPLHEEAKEYQRRMLLGQSVKILFGPKRVDDKGRTLGLVFYSTDTFLNADLVMNGYAKVQTDPPNTEYRDLFLRLQEYAQKNQLGIWKTP